MFQTARVLSVFGAQMQSVAIGWQIYSITGRAIDLAWVGLAQFFPAVALSLVTGHVADRIQRRRILIACYGAMALLSGALFVVARSGQVAPIYAVLVGVGVVRAFQGPASQSMLPSARAMKPSRLAAMNSESCGAILRSSPVAERPSSVDRAGAGVGEHGSGLAQLIAKEQCERVFPQTEPLNLQLV